MPYSKRDFGYGNAGFAHLCPVESGVCLVMPSFVQVPGDVFLMPKALSPSKTFAQPTLESWPLVGRKLTAAPDGYTLFPPPIIPSTGDCTRTHSPRIQRWANRGRPLRSLRQMTSCIHSLGRPCANDSGKERRVWLTICFISSDLVFLFLFLQSFLFLQRLELLAGQVDDWLGQYGEL